jgi:predicted TIM-barrel fold metal-dependent hydrolase
MARSDQGRQHNPGWQLKGGISMIVDTHVHVIADDEKKYPKVLPGPEGQPKWPVVTGELLLQYMKENGVDRALTVQAYWTYEYDNAYAIDMALAHPKFFQSVVVFDPRHPEVPDLLAELVKNREVKGVRVMRTAEDIFRDPRSFATWKRAWELKIPVIIGRVEKHLVPDARAILDRFPGIQLVLDHSWASPPLAKLKPPYTDYFEPLLELGRNFPNLFLKVCPNITHDLQVPGADPKAFWNMVIDAFGADRLMWGSNFPAYWDIMGMYAERLAVMRKDLAFLGKQEQDWIFGETALRLWPGLR